MRFNESLNNAIDRLLAEHDNVYILGEDIVDPYGGAFKVTKGLSSKHENRIIPTPISESAIVGMGIGMAMRGLLPVVEIMFGDFTALAFDQILNSATKFESMYNGQVRVPLTIRTPMGGGRGYGPTHSQCLEKFFLGIPGFKVIAPSLYNDIYPLLNHAVCKDTDPKLFIEHKLLYPLNIKIPENGIIDDFFVDVSCFDSYPTLALSLVPLGKCEVTILAYGYSATLSKDVAYELMINEEISCHIIIPTLLSPFNYDMLFKSIESTGKLLIVEEGTMRNGFGAEITSVVQDRMFSKLSCPVKRIASLDGIIPSSKNLEEKTLVSKSKIQEAISKMVQMAEKAF